MPPVGAVHFARFAALGLVGAVHFAHTAVAAPVAAPLTSTCCTAFRGSGAAVAVSGCFGSAGGAVANGAVANEAVCAVGSL